MVDTATQLAILVALSPGVRSWSQCVYDAVAATVFLLVGQRVFRWVSVPAFHWLLTLVAGAYAVILGLTSAGVLWGDSWLMQSPFRTVKGLTLFKLPRPLLISSTALTRSSDRVRTGMRMAQGRAGTPPHMAGPVSFPPRSVSE